MASEHYEEYKKKLLQLHDLEAQGKFESSEYDQVCDAMDAPGYKLSGLELKRIKDLAGDLNMLLGDEIKVKSEKSIDPREFERVANSEQWDDLLDMLRLENFPATEDQIASTRSACWSALGDYDVALLFAEYASKLKPENPNYRIAVTINRLNLGLPVAPAAMAEMSSVMSHHVLNNSIHEMSFLKSA